MKLYKLFFTLVMIGGVLPLLAQDPIGMWKTIDDKTGEAKSHIEIFESSGQYYGRIVEVIQDDYIEACNRCPGDKRGQAIEGLVIIENVSTVRKNRTWRGGTVLDPNSGKVFSFSMWFPKNRTDVLKVRGKHWSGVYRTQTWYRITAR